MGEFKGWITLDDTLRKLGDLTVDDAQAYANGYNQAIEDLIKAGAIERWEVEHYTDEAVNLSGDGNEDLEVIDYIIKNTDPELREDFKQLEVMYFLVIAPMRDREIQYKFLQKAVKENWGLFKFYEQVKLFKKGPTEDQ